MTNDLSAIRGPHPVPPGGSALENEIQASVVNGVEMGLLVMFCDLETRAHLFELTDAGLEESLEHLRGLGWEEGGGRGGST